MFGAYVRIEYNNDVQGSFYVHFICRFGSEIMVIFDVVVCLVVSFGNEIFCGTVVVINVGSGLFIVHGISVDGVGFSALLVSGLLIVGGLVLIILINY